MFSFIFGMLGLMLAGLGIILLAGIVSIPFSIIFEAILFVVCLNGFTKPANRGKTSNIIRGIILAIILIDVIGFGELLIWGTIIFISYKIGDRILRWAQNYNK